MAVLVPVLGEAQTPPRPSVSVTQLPRFQYNNTIADFNEDGRLDLIGAAGVFASPTVDLILALGAGNGTFAPATSMGVAAAPLAVADFNNDGHQDVVVGTISILPGRGNGTFGAARHTAATPRHPNDDEFPTAMVAADFNNDGKVDLLIGASLYSGRGDFTFGAPYDLAAASGYAAVAADFNGDGRKDLAVMRPFEPIDVLVNQGAFLFATAPSVTLTSIGIQSLATGDLNKDGKADLIAVTSFNSESGDSEGQVHVLLGRGDGTFATDVAYPIGVRGRLAAVTVAIGDFNRDGHLDVASGGRSARYYDTFWTGIVLWDSVSIAAGRGDGTLGSQASFRLGTNNYTDELYQLTHRTLVSGDLNADGFTDLVTSPGAVLLGRAAVPNRAPQVSAGPDQTMQGGSGYTPLDGTVIDADNDWLRFEWRNQDGLFASRVPVRVRRGARHLHPDRHRRPRGNRHRHDDGLRSADHARRHRRLPSSGSGPRRSPRHCDAVPADLARQQHEPVRRRLVSAVLLFGRRPDLDADCRLHQPSGDREVLHVDCTGTRHLARANPARGL